MSDIQDFVGEGPPAPDGDLAQKAARGGLVVILAQISRLMLLLVSLVVLGRLLTPREFGIYAFALSLVGVAELLRDFGLSSSAVSAQELPSAEKSNLFWMNSALGLALAVVIAVTGLFWAAARPDSAVSWAMVGLSAVYLLNGIQTQFQVELTRAFRFTALAVTDVASQAFGLGIGILMAMGGAGYWSLVVMQVSVAATLLLLRSLIASWIPERPRLGVAMRHHVSYGWNLGIAQAMSYFALNTPVYALAGLAGPASVGIFSRSLQLVYVPMNQVFAPLTNVALPSLTHVYGGPSFRQHFRSLSNLVTLVGAAGFAILFSVAPWLTPLLLGPSWHDAIPVVEWLCVGTMAHAATFPFFWAFLSSRNTGALLRYNLVSKPPIAILVVLGAWLGGAQGAAIGLASGLLVSWPICAAWLRADPTFNSREVFVDAAKILLAAGSAMAVAAFAHLSFDTSLAGSLAGLGGGVAAAAAVGACLRIDHCLRRAIQVVGRVRSSKTIAEDTSAQ